MFTVHERTCSRKVPICDADRPGSRGYPPIHRRLASAFNLIVSAIVAAIAAEVARRIGFIDVASEFIHIQLAAAWAGAQNRLGY